MIDVKENQDKKRIKERHLTSLLVQLFLALIFVVGLYLISFNSKTEIEHTIIPSRIELPEHQPMANDLLLWQDKLQLSTLQRSQLIQINSELLTETDPIEKQIHVHTQKFRSKVKEADRRLSFADLANAAKPATELGRKKRVLEASSSEEALSLLTDQQRKKALMLYKNRQRQETMEVKDNDGSD